MRETIYDHPHAYDLLFGWDRSPEADFYEAVFEGAGVGRDEPVLEVACGTGRVARLLARRGRRMLGLDSRANMVAFLEARARQEGLAIEAFQADMASFEVPTRLGGAYNPMSSFRLLHTREAMLGHLRAMATALRPGGLYVLDLELAGGGADPPDGPDESWEMEADGLWVRAEPDRVRVREGGPERELAWGDELHLRPLPLAEWTSLLEALPELTLRGYAPESGRTAEGVSTFDPRLVERPSTSTRTMAVLERNPDA